MSNRQRKMAPIRGHSSCCFQSLGFVMMVMVMVMEIVLYDVGRMLAHLG